MAFLSGFSLVGAYLKYSPVGFFSIPWIELYFFLTLFLATVILVIFSLPTIPLSPCGSEIDEKSKASSLVNSSAVADFRQYPFPFAKSLIPFYLRYRECFLFFFLFVGIFLFQAKDLLSTSIWLDEDYQIWTSLYQLPVYAGSQQHQPPLHFALLGGWLPQFGFTEFSVRLFTLFFSSLGATVFAYFLKTLSSSWYSLFFALPLYLFHPFIIRYSYEVRPVGIGLFCSILWIKICYSLGREQKSSFRSIFPLAAATFVTLTAFGFQGPALGLAMAIAFLLDGSSKSKRMIGILGLLLGLLMFLPIQLNIFQNAPPRFGRIPHFSVLHFLSGYQLATYKNFLGLYLAPLLPFFFLLSGFGLLFLGWKKFLRSVWVENRWAFLLILTTLLVTFPFFVTYVDWPFQPYYYLFLWPILFLILMRVFPLVFPSKAIWIPSVFFFALVIALIKFENPFFSSFANFSEPRADLRSAIRKALEVSKDGKETLILPVCGGSENEWCPNWIIGKDIYLSQRATNGASVRFPPMDTLAFFTILFRHPVALDRIIWLFQDDWSKYRAVPYFVKNETEIRAEQYFGASLLFQNTDDGDARLHVLEGLKKFERAAVEQSKDAFWIRAHLAYGYVLLGKKGEAEFWWQKLPRQATSNDAKAWLEAIEREKLKL